jgi:hypothetical protein
VTRCCTALALALTAGAAAFTSRPPGASAATYSDPGAILYTIAGLGTVAPRDGMPAASARLAPCGLAALPDASLVVGDCASNPAALWRIDGAGMLHAIPTPPGLVTFAADQAGGVYVLDSRNRVIHLAPATWAASTVAVTSSIRGFNTSYGVLAAAAAGSALVSDGAHVWDVSAGAPARALAGPGGTALAVLSDGAVASAERGYGVRRTTPAGATTLVWPSQALRDYALATAPSGELLAADWYLSSYAPDPQALYGHISAIAPDGTRTPLAGQAPGLGNGDGQPGTALRSRLGGESRLTAVTGVADGTLAFTDTGVRLLAPADSPRPLAALSPAAYAGARTGRIAYTTTLAGRTHLELSRGGTVVRRVDATAAPGVNALAFAPPASGDYVMTLTVTAADGRTAAARAAVSTGTRLPLRRGRKLIADYVAQTEQGDGGLGGGEEVYGCRSVGPLRVDCRRRSYTYMATSLQPTAQYRTHHGRCDARLSERLRPDGLDMVRLSCR